MNVTYPFQTSTRPTDTTDRVALPTDGRPAEHLSCVCLCAQKHLWRYRSMTIPPFGSRRLQRPKCSCCCGSCFPRRLYSAMAKSGSSSSAPAEAKAKPQGKRPDILEQCIVQIISTVEGSPATFLRPCVDCGRTTSNFCDECLAATRVPSEVWAENQHTPFCTRCEILVEACHFCCGVHWCIPLGYLFGDNFSFRRT